MNTNFNKEIHFIHHRPKITDNYNEWYAFYSGMMRNHYSDFVKLFGDNQAPSFDEFMEYCYNNTSSYYNHRKSKYECRLY